MHVTKNKPFQHKEPPLGPVRLLDYGETSPIFKSKRKCSCWLPGLYRRLLLFLELYGRICILLIGLFSEGVYKPLDIEVKYI